MDLSCQLFHPNILLIWELKYQFFLEELIVSLFLNYDCDESVPDLISEIVSTLEKINQAKFEDSDWINAEEATQLRKSSLGSLVKLLRSLLRWTEGPAVEEDIVIK